MIKNILNENEKITPNSKELEVLKEHFPACFNKDGSFDIERFKGFLSDKVDINDEGYELKFLGKNYARLLAALATTVGVLTEVPLMLFLVKIANSTKHWFPTKQGG